MNFKHCIYYIAAALLGASALSSCSDDATLENSDQIYLEIEPSNFSLCLRDTVPIKASISNENGDEIKAPVSWSIERESGASIDAVRIIELTDTLGNFLGYAVTPDDNALGYSCKLVASLENGKKTWTRVTVKAHNPEAVTPVEGKETLRLYNNLDTAWFQVKPTRLLLDYEPKVSFINDSIRLADREPIIVDYETGRVAVVVRAPRISGEGAVILTLGEGKDAVAGRVNVTMVPILETTFYDPETSSRPDYGLLKMYWKVVSDALMDYEAEKTFYIAVNVQGGSDADINNARNSYSITSDGDGKAAVLRETSEVIYTNKGFDVKLTIGTRSLRGKSTINVVFPDTVLKVNVSVENFKVDRPVEEITTNYDATGEIVMAAGQSVALSVGTVPSTSFNAWPPVITCDDPELVEIGAYNGNAVTLRGLKPGESLLRFKANDCEKTLAIRITEGVNSVNWTQGLIKEMFVGQTYDWGINVRTTSGAPNTYPATFTSDDENIAVAEAIEGDITAGKVTAVGVGETTIYATVLDKTSPASDGKVTVYDVPADFTIDEAFLGDEGYGYAYDDDGNLIVAAFVNDAATYEFVISGAEGEYNGTWDAATTPIIFRFNGARAQVTSGTITLVETDNGLSATFRLTITIGDKSFTVTANGFETEL